MAWNGQMSVTFLGVQVSWLDSFKDLSAPQRWLKISFPALQFRGGLLIVIWMVSLSSLTICLQS